LLANSLWLGAPLRRANNRIFAALHNKKAEDSEFFRLGVLCVSAFRFF